jgi:hypothetical protein
MSANVGAKEIVTDGLVLYLDAANYKSYTSGSTVWRDMSGNNYSGSLINGPTFSSANGGSIVFDGVDDFIQTSYFGNATDAYTFSAWFKNDDYSETKYVLVRGRDGFGNGWSLAIVVGSNSKAASAVVPTIPNTAQINASGTIDIPLNIWCYLTGVWIPDNSINIYVNGVLDGTTSAVGTTNLRSSTNGFVLGSITSTNFTSGNVAITQIYNRALSAQEILQNYNATKNRFGIQ